VPPDFLKGHLKIVWLGAAEASDEMPRSEVAPESYAAYPLVILSQEGKAKSRESLRTGMETIVFHSLRATTFWMRKDGRLRVTSGRNRSGSRLFQTRLSMSIWISIPAFVETTRFQNGISVCTDLASSNSSRAIAIARKRAIVIAA